MNRAGPGRWSRYLRRSLYAFLGFYPISPGAIEFARVPAN